MKRLNSFLALASVSLHAIAALLPRGVSGDGECGMGSCDESGDHVFGFACRCSPGWSRYHLDDIQFPFLPYVMPNCTINYSCQDRSPPPAPSPPPPAVPPPTVAGYCGGGSCEKAASSDFAHRCACRDGFRNILDDDAYPCYRQCSLGSDCAGLGISILNGTDPSTSPPAPVSFTFQKNSAASGSSTSANRLQELLMLVSFFWVQTV